MKIKLLVFSFIYLFLIAQSYAITFENKISSEELTKKLPKIENIECKFKQEKQLKNIQKPLLSGGNFKFIKNEGVFFETTYPIKQTYSYTNKDYKQINDIILAISNKKYSKLDREFDFFYLKNNNGEWNLTLKPKENTTVEKYLDYIDIEGKEYIQKLTIMTKDGNKTTQWFITD